MDPQQLTAERPDPAALKRLFERANAEQGEGRFADAAATCRDILARDETYAGAWHLLGILAFRAGDAATAAAHVERAVALAPTRADSRCTLGFVLRTLNRQPEAEAAFRRAIERDPDFVEAHYQLGNLLRETQRPAEAEASYRRVLALHPDHYQAHNNRGAALGDLGRFDEAVEHFRRATAIKPDYAETHANLGHALRATGRAEEAEVVCRRAVALAPDFATGHLNLGLALQDLGRLDEALGELRAAQAAQPGYAMAIASEAMALLQRGEFAAGWEKYEARWRIGELRPRNFAQPQWRGEPLAGKTILLHAEQGAGDAIQFLRYVPLVAARGGRVVVEVRKALIPLVARMPGIDVVAHGERLPAFDLHCPLMSLPLCFATTLETIPSATPYLSPAPGTAARWRTRLDIGRELKVGLVWAGSAANRDDRNRSIPLDRLGPLLAVAGVRWFSLQVGPRAAELAHLKGTAVADLAPELGDFGETAGVIAALDLVIAAETAVAHLAGALGKPVWLMLPFAADWRWMVGRDDSPWYRSMRLFRQTQPGNWAGVAARVRAALADMVERARRRARPGVEAPEGLVAAEIIATRLLAENKLTEAEAALRDLTARAPQRAKPWFLLGRVRHALGDTDMAIDFLRKASALDPTMVPAHNDLGILLQGRGALEEAEACYRRAIELSPRFAAAMSNLGAVLAERGHLEQATTWYSRAISERDDLPDAHNNLGAALVKLDRAGEAEAMHRRAIALRPDFAGAHYNLGVALQDLARFDEAMASYEAALRLNPDYVDAHWNRAYVLLLKGDLAQGWREHEWRQNRKLRPPRAFPQPLWHGEDIAGRTILLHHEQGMGDTLQFVRYAPVIAARGARVLVQVQRPLLRLVAGSLLPGIEVFTDGDVMPPFDLHSPLMSVPLACGTTLDTIPRATPYLKVDPAAAARWRNRVGSADALKVGLVWSGNPQHKNDRNRSIEFDGLAPLLDVAGVRWFSLQAGERSADLARAPAGRIANLADRFIDFAASAAAIAALDLVITVDTATAHLAGALGKPVWVLLPFVPDWRWMLERDDSPWYPTARLFRQPARGDWESVVQAVRAALDEIVRRKPGN